MKYTQVFMYFQYKIWKAVNKQINFTVLDDEDFGTESHPCYQVMVSLWKSSL